MKIIELTQGKSVIVSDEDFVYLNQWKWYYNNGYVVRRCYITTKIILMYKVILEKMGITLKKNLKIKYKLDYRREILIPVLDLSPGTKEIPLTQGKVAIVDIGDYEYLMQWNWYYAGGYAARRECGQAIHMHRVVLERAGFKNFEEVDHINHDKLNNRKINLRPATRQENSRNGRPQKGTSKYKGIYWYKSRNKWHARIMVNGKKKHLGYFISEKEAAKAYNKAARKYFGEFAHLNIGEL